MRNCPNINTPSAGGRIPFPSWAGGKCVTCGLGHSSRNAFRWFLSVSVEIPVPPMARGASARWAGCMGMSRRWPPPMGKNIVSPKAMRRTPPIWKPFSRQTEAVKIRFGLQPDQRSPHGTWTGSRHGQKIHDVARNGLAYGNMPQAAASQLTSDLVERSMIPIQNRNPAERPNHAHLAHVVADREEFRHHLTSQAVQRGHMGILRQSMGSDSRKTCTDTTAQSCRAWCGCGARSVRSLKTALTKPPRRALRQVLSSMGDSCPFWPNIQSSARAWRAPSAGQAILKTLNSPDAGTPGSPRRG